MDTLSYKTISANKETADKKWLVVDATGVNLGRLSSEVASLLRGKHKPLFTPHADCGDNVIVVNADKILDNSNGVLNKRKEFNMKAFEDLKLRRPINK